MSLQNLIKALKEVKNCDQLASILGLTADDWKILKPQVSNKNIKSTLEQMGKIEADPEQKTPITTEKSALPVKTLRAMITKVKATCGLSFQEAVLLLRGDMKLDGSNGMPVELLCVKAWLGKLTAEELNIFINEKVSVNSCSALKRIHATSPQVILRF